MDRAPLSKARAFAPAAHLAPDVHAFELRRILARGWQVVAPSPLVHAPCDLIARELGRDPVVIVRAAFGALQGWRPRCSAPRASTRARSDSRRSTCRSGEGSCSSALAQESWVSSSCTGAPYPPGEVPMATHQRALALHLRNARSGLAWECAPDVAATASGQVERACFRVR